jgi:HAD superfamily hydrolase (TIGR01509 family)
MVARVPPQISHPPRRRPIEAVMFDFHGTIAQVEDPVEWVLAAAAECGITLDPMLATSLADRLVAAGRAGGPRPARVPPHLAEVWGDRDLRPDDNRAAYQGLAETVTAELHLDGFTEALYERVLRPEGWRAYPDAAPTMRALQEAGIPVGVLSNIGFDIRPICAGLGLAEHVTTWTLSYEVGACKPDPEIFRHACRSLGVPPERALMVGDTPADAGAVDAGCCVLVLPHSPPGVSHGLNGALSLALP